MSRPRLVCLMQLPPPVHGAAVMNRFVAESDVIASRFDLRVVRLQFATSIDDVGAFSFRKVARAVSTAGALVRQLAARPDAVYFTLAPSGGAFYRDCVYLAAIKASGATPILHLHGLGVAANARGWKRHLYRWAFEDTRVIHLSPRLMPDVADVVPLDRIAFVSNGIPDCPAAPPRAPNAVPRILFLSNLMPTKGPLVLLEALGLLAQSGASFEATFAGAPFGDVAEQLDAGIRRFGLEGRVRYIGPVFGDAKDEVVAAHDIFAFPTLIEAFGLVLLEAMRAGLAVVASREGAIPDILDSGAAGVLVPKGDAPALAGALDTLLRDPALRARLGVSARARFQRRYTLEHFEAALADAIADAIG